MDFYGLFCCQENTFKEVFCVNGLIIGGAVEKAFAWKNGIQPAISLNIALPVYDELLCSDRPLMGFRGACFLAEMIWNQVIKSRLKDF